VEDWQLSALKARLARSSSLTLLTGRSQSLQRRFAAPLLRRPTAGRLEARHSGPGLARCHLGARPAACATLAAGELEAPVTLFVGIAELRICDLFHRIPDNCGVGLPWQPAWSIERDSREPKGALGLDE